MLYIVSTPIGNLKDISERALDTLRSVDVIIAESPSDSIKLLNAYNISGKKIIKFNEKNKRQSLESVMTLLKEKNAAYITSAGTPGISDPGQDLVKEARERGVEVRAIPGPSALISAISVSGIRTKRFTFISFPPKKSGQLKKLFEEFKSRGEVLIFFESTHRILKTLEVLTSTFPEVYICVAKELTKIFERCFVGKSKDVFVQIKIDPKSRKGEFVIIVDFAGYKKSLKRV